MSDEYKEDKIHKGRQKGTPNKRSLHAMKKIYGDLNADPLKFMTDVMNMVCTPQNKLSPEDIAIDHRLAAAKELAKYCFPQLKSMDLGELAAAEAMDSHVNQAPPRPKNFEEFMSRAKKLGIEATTDEVGEA